MHYVATSSLSHACFRLPRKNVIGLFRYFRRRHYSPIVLHAITPILCHANTSAESCLHLCPMDWITSVLMMLQTLQSQSDTRWGRVVREEDIIPD